MIYELHKKTLSEIANRLQVAISDADMDNLDVKVSIYPIHQLGCETVYIGNIPEIRVSNIRQDVPDGAFKKHRDIIESILHELAAALSFAQEDHYTFNITQNSAGTFVNPADSRLSI